MTEKLIDCQNVGKLFCRDLKRGLWYGIKDIAKDLLLRHEPCKDSTGIALRKGEFWANKDVSFQVHRGECLGLIGRNGAGKTTLLKMLNGLIKPDAGAIEVRGQVAALIALGAGFNPILTGRENIFVNGSILGISRKTIRAQIDEIIEFAEIKDFIDTPAKNYSSGMQVRLGFAIAAVLAEPDVLLLDEVLAVGDAGFRAKCYAKIAEMIKTAAVILVSHNMEAVSRICDRAILLAGGAVQMDTTPAIASQRYLSSFSPGKENLTVAHGFEVSEISFEQDRIKFGDRLVVRYRVYSPKEISNPIMKLNIYTFSGECVAEFNSINEGIELTLENESNNLIEITLQDVRLHPQDYLVSISIISDRSNHLVWWRNAGKFCVFGEQQGHQAYLIRGSLVNIHE